MSSNNPSKKANANQAPAPPQAQPAQNPPMTVTLGKGQGQPQHQSEPQNPAQFGGDVPMSGAEGQPSGTGGARGVQPAQ